MENREPAIQSQQIIPSSVDNDIVQALNMDSWVPGQNLASLYSKLEHEVIDSLANEEVVINTIRREIFPLVLKQLLEIKPQIANKQFSSIDIEKAHLGLLFNGSTEASDGTIVTHDTLPLTVTQIGVCLVSYQGEQGAYAHRIYRKDLQMKGEDPIREVLQLLDDRRKQSSVGEDESRFAKSMLAQRGLMAYAERAILMEKSNARWRMGHGNPLPYELLTGFWASRPEMTKSALALFEKIVKHERFVFIPSAPKRRELLAIGNALKPLEYIVIDYFGNDLRRIIDNGGAREPMLSHQLEHVEKYGDQIVYGLFKTSAMAPAYMFYAHKDHIQTAALIAIADSVLQEHRGFPMLIDIADNICSATFSPDTFFSTIRNAYSEAGQPFKFLSERETRNK